MRTAVPAARADCLQSAQSAARAAQLMAKRAGQDAARNCLLADHAVILGHLADLGKSLTVLARDWAGDWACAAGYASGYAAEKSFAGAAASLRSGLRIIRKDVIFLQERQQEAGQRTSGSRMLAAPAKEAAAAAGSLEEQPWDELPLHGHAQIAGYLTYSAGSLAVCLRAEAVNVQSAYDRIRRNWLARDIRGDAPTYLADAADTSAAASRALSSLRGALEAAVPVSA